MFLTVTPNPALDQVLFIEAWRPGVPSQALQTAASVGGKGLDASVALRHLGQPTRGLHFAAGQTGRALLHLLEQYGITPEPVWVDGETRTAHIIAETECGTHTHIFTGGLVITPAHLSALLARFAALMAEARFCLTGGKLPAGVPQDLFRTLAEGCARAGVPLLVDSFGAPLLACLPARPAVVKLNRAEFCATFTPGTPALSLVELQKAAAQVQQQHRLPALVVTCGADGLLAFTEAGAWRAVAPPQKALNAAGAGDAASAALAWRLAEGDDWPSALRWAAAVSAAVVLTPGTADFEPDAARGLLAQVRVERV